MGKEEIGGIVRAVAAALGGYLVGKGMLSETMASDLAGAVVIIATAVWSVIAKRKA